LVCFNLTEKASLYIHIPFCSSKCDYCDFYSIAAGSLSDEDIDTILLTLVKNIKHQIDYFNVKEIPSVYIGGGTPSVLGRKISVLINALNNIENFSPQEFTIEANPESVTEEFLEICREGGVNRLSLGVQTFHEPSRIAVNRGRKLNNNKNIILASKYFPESLSVDLIAGLPFQDEKVIAEDIKRILDFNPAHVSLYSLTVEDGTPLKEKIKTKSVTLPPGDLADSLWLTGKDALLKEGFEHYEISNFAKPGKRSLHNIRYWLMKNWIGVGPSASGTVINENTGTAVRYTYDNDVFSAKSVCEELDKKTLLKESLLMGYRYVEGPDLQLFRQRFGRGVEDCIPQTMARWVNKDKMLFLNAFLTEAFEELEGQLSMTQS